jgi:hypothetical protein
LSCWYIGASWKAYNNTDSTLWYTSDARSSMGESVGEDCGSGVAQSGLEGSGVLTRVASAEDVNTAFSLVVMSVEDGMGSGLDKFGGDSGTGISGDQPI